MNHNDVDKNITLMHCLAVCRNALFLLPVIVIYYKSQLGLTFQQFVLGEVAFSLTVLVMEIPSGWLSDVWKRKHILALSILSASIGWVLLLADGGFVTAVLAQCIIGVAVSLYSGTDAAVLYETLLQGGREREFRALMGKQSAVAFYSLALASLAGGFLYKIDPRAPIYAILLFKAAAFAAALMLREPIRAQRRVEKNPLHDMALTIHEAVIKKRDLGLLMLGAALLFGSTQYNVWAQQAYWKALDLGPEMFGLLGAAGWGLAGIAGHIGHHVERRFGYLKTFVCLWMALCCVWLFTGLHLGWLGVAGLFLGSMAWAIGWPALQDAINRQVGSERRATVISTASLMVRLSFLLVGSLASWVADHHGVQDSLLLLGAFHAGFGFLAFAGFRIGRRCLWF